MKVVKRTAGLVLMVFLLVLGLGILVVGSGSLEADNLTSTTGGISISPKELAERFGNGATEETASNALAVANRLMSQHHFTVQGASGALAVGFRESGWRWDAVNDSGGVAGFFQWSGWGSTINGNRWGQAKSKDLTQDVELDLISTELNGSYQKVVEKVGTQTDAAEAAKNWSYYYEGVALSDGQSKVSQITEWANTLSEILASAQSAFAQDNNTGTTLTAIPDGWGDISQYDGHAYEGSGSYPAGQCTWYVYNRAKQLGISFDPFMGNGGQWYQKAGYSASHTPKEHTAVSFVQGLAGSDPTYGHVAFCEAVKDDGSILISEMNAYGVPPMTVSYRILDPQTASQVWYVEGH